LKLKDMKTNEMAENDLQENQQPSAVGSVTASDAAPPQASTDESARLKQERDELFDRLARLQAEFDNYRKRSQREQEDFRAYAVSEAVKLFLPVLDNFNLALKHKQSSADDLRKGIELIRKQFEDALQKLGVQPIDAHGAEFDPRHHEAIEMVHSDEHGDNQVIEELQRGYKMRDRLLRPAMVRVARKK
jgi:molecular chaperone GrpE